MLKESYEYFRLSKSTPFMPVYTLDKDGSVIVNNSCKKADGVFTSSVGHAYFESDSNVGKLQVTFAPNWLSWMKLAYGDYWVIDTNYSSYALVGDSSRQYLWILSRTPQLNLQDMAKLTEEAGRNEQTKVEVNSKLKDQRINFEETKKQGVLIGKGGLYGNVIRTGMMLNSTKDNVDELIAALDKGFAIV